MTLTLTIPRWLLTHLLSVLFTTALMLPIHALAAADLQGVTFTGPGASLGVWGILAVPSLVAYWVLWSITDSTVPAYSGR
jgi:hypothetical protein